MFKFLSKILVKPKNVLYNCSSLANLKLKEENYRKLLKITCKRTNFNLTENENYNPDIKFGDIPLASSGWKHSKSKGDFFTIHASEKDNVFGNWKNVNDLKNLGVANEFIRNLRNELDIEKITDIQETSFVEIMNMNHVLIAAETGCGKTLAYLLPIVQQILEKKKMSKNEHRDFNSPIALVLTPGRELASQIGAAAELLCSGTDIKIKTLLGGKTKQKLLNPTFEDVDILIGSLGVISKHITNNIYRMSKVHHIVLDEADTLLDDSFSDKLCHILKRFPLHKNHLQDSNGNKIGTQLLLVSATMPSNIDDLLSRIINTETIHEIISPNLHYLMTHITQKFIRMNKSDRPSKLLTLVKSELRKNHPIIVFSNKTPTCDFISIFLNNSGVNCVNLNGDMLMAIRVGQFEKFQKGDVDVLSTTDVGSRGLDTIRARHIINFDFPLHISDYIHRCGRIGRIANLSDKYFITNFISSQREIEIVQKIEHSARTGNKLPNVNANITNLIKKKILKSIDDVELKSIF